MQILTLADIAKKMGRVFRDIGEAIPTEQPQTTTLRKVTLIPILGRKALRKTPAVAITGINSYSNKSGLLPGSDIDH